MFSAVSSAFVSGVQSKLEPDSGDRSETYLHAILSASTSLLHPPNNLTTSNLLYVSLLMSLLASCVTVLGKQLLNCYLQQ